jgi:hypothetical protein
VPMLGLPDSPEGDDGASMNAPIGLCKKRGIVMSEHPASRNKTESSTPPTREAKPKTIEVSHENRLQPNMLLQNARATSSTLDHVDFDHSVFNRSNFHNTAFMQIDFSATHFNFCRLDGSLLQNCSLKGVELRDCDVDGLIINGVRVGALLKAFWSRS